MGEPGAKDHYGDFAVVRIPEGEKRTMLNQLMVFLGVLAVWAAVFGGASMAAMLDAEGVLLASVLGSLALGAIAFLTGLIGGYTSLPTYVILRHSMGRFGSIAAGIAISEISAAPWFAFETWLFGAIMHETFPGNRLTRVEVAAAKIRVPDPVHEEHLRAAPEDGRKLGARVHEDAGGPSRWTS